MTVIFNKNELVQERRRGQAPCIGEVFLYLTVISGPWIENSRSHVRCRCKCGKEVAVRVNSLRQKISKSCGCLQREKVVEKNWKHGAARRGRRMPEHVTWTLMIARCYNPNTPRFSNYGGRGIKVCPRWKNSFSAFLSDMGLKPNPELSIDRIDNNGNYEPGNCRWATDEQQANNNRRNRRFTLDGETKTLTEWAAKIGVTPSTLFGRLRRGKMTLREALTSPARPTGNWKKK